MKAGLLMEMLGALIADHGDCDVKVLADGDKRGDVIGIKYRSESVSKPIIFELSSDAPGKAQFVYEG
jgi:hypothetical protein